MNSSGSTILLYCIAAAVALMAYATGQNWSFATESAIAFVIVRFLYSLFYSFNIPLARSLLFRHRHGLQRYPLHLELTGCQ